MLLNTYEDKVTLIITRHNSTGLATSVDLTSIEIPRDGGSETALTHGGVVEAGDAQFVTSGTASIDIEAWDGRNEIEFDAFESGTNSGSLGMTSSPEGEFTENAVIDINSLLTSLDASLDAHLEEEGLGFDIADLGFNSYQVEA